MRITRLLNRPIITPDLHDSLGGLLNARGGARIQEVGQHLLGPGSWRTL